MIRPSSKHSAWYVGVAAFVLMSLALLYIVRFIVNQPEYVAGVSFNRDSMAAVPAVDQSPQITANHPIAQTFIPRADNLARVEVIAVTFDRTNTSPLVFSVFEDGTGEALRSAEIQADDIVGGEPITVQFDPIADSEGESYRLLIESPEGEPGNAFGAWVSNCDCNPNGTLFLGNVPQENADLVLAVAYQNEDVVIRGELLNRMSQYKPDYLKGPFLATIGILAFGLSLLAYAVFVGSMVNHTERVRAPVHPDDGDRSSG